MDSKHEWCIIFPAAGVSVSRVHPDGPSSVAGSFPTSIQNAESYITPFLHYIPTRQPLKSISTKPKIGISGACDNKRHCFSQKWFVDLITLMRVCLPGPARLKRSFLPCFLPRLHLSALSPVLAYEYFKRLSMPRQVCAFALTDRWRQRAQRGGIVLRVFRVFRWPRVTFYVGQSVRECTS